MSARQTAGLLNFASVIMVIVIIALFSKGCTDKKEKVVAITNERVLADAECAKHKMLAFRYADGSRYIYFCAYGYIPTGD